MIDLNKPSFIEEHIARAIGCAIGSINSIQGERKAAKAQYEQTKNRQDMELAAIRQDRK